MDYFPAFMNLRGRKAVVVGGGAAAARKAAMLARSGARVTIIAPDLSPKLSGDAYTHLADSFDDRHLNGAALVIAASDDRDLNRLVARHARLRGLPVNVVDDPELSSFIMPAIIDRPPVTVAISTGGASPVLARWVRARIETVLPASLGRIATLAARMRRTARARIPDIDARRRFWERALDGPAAELALAGRDAAAAALLHRALDNAGREEGQVWLVGAGPGDPELLTVKALRALQTADVVVHDRLVSDDVLELARRDADRVFVGKRAGDHAMAQRDINDLLIRLARAGKRVVRLKGGDPFMFGRGGEEMTALAEAGIVCHLVPGITAAAGCAAEAGIPLTHRDFAQSCVFVTGHGGNGLPDLDWDGLARARQTLVVYMGLGNLDAICDRLAEHGLSPATPAAVISNGCTPEARTIIATLGDIAQRAEAAETAPPALLIIGDVVRLARSETVTQYTATENAA